MPELVLPAVNPVAVRYRARPPDAEGLGRYAQTPSNSGDGAVSITAEPKKENLRETVARRIAAASYSVKESKSFKKRSAILS